MRSGGINWLAVVSAAIAIYAIGFVIYAMLIPEESWMVMSGMTEEAKAIAMSRMPFSPVMPILTAIFMAYIFKLGSVGDAKTGAKWAILIALASAIPTLLYAWVYGGNNTNMTLVDSGHLLLGHTAAGAILGRWR